MSQYQNFTSLPPDEEQTFVVYEQRSVEGGATALKLGLIAGAVLFASVFLTVCVAYPNAGHNLMEGEDMGMLADEAEQDKSRNSMSGTPATPAKPATPVPEGAAAPGAEGAAAPGAEGAAAPGAEGAAAPAGGAEPAPADNPDESE